MLFSRGTEYALRAALHLAAQPAGERLSVPAVAEALGLPLPYLAKLVRELGRAGVVTTASGKGGGVALARPASELTLSDVVDAIRGPGAFEGCLLRLPGCGERTPCPLHEQWVPIRAYLAGVFRRTTLAEAAVRPGPWAQIGP